MNENDQQGTISKEQFLELIEANPKLTAFGFGAQRWSMIEKGREILKESYVEFCLCCEWLRLNPISQKGRTAYIWKHRVEHWLRDQEIKPDYIYEGVFMAAAKAMGYSLHKIRRSTGAKIGYQPGGKNGGLNRS